MSDENFLQTLQLEDGRVLSYVDWGERSGSPLIFLHGLPGSRLQAWLIKSEAIEQGHRLIAVDRPGFGHTDYYENRQMLDLPRDIEQLVDFLNISKFSVLGISGGGPYALACGHYFADRVTQIGIVSGLGPLSIPELEKTLSPPIKAALKTYRKHPQIIEYALKKSFQFIEKRPVRFIERFQMFISKRDRDVLCNDEVAANFEKSVQESLRQGVKGTIKDLKILIAEWGFQLDEITGPVLLWHGKKDKVVPYQMTEYYQRHLPRSQCEFFPREGHYSLPLRHASQILSKLSGVQG